MEKLISCCGLNCATCEARIATIKNDDELRKETAEKWKTFYNVPDMSPAMINCTGCREQGVKIGHWSMCPIRLCAEGKGFSTCGECKEMDPCNLISGVHKSVPEAIINLKNLKN
jgi:hypothetical protein